MTGQEIAQRLQELSAPELAGLWRAAHQARTMGALAYVESELIRRARILAARHKGGAGSGHHGHAGIPGHQGGSAPSSGAGGGAAMHLRPTPEQIARWDSEIQDWGGPRGGCAHAAMYEIKNNRAAAFVIEEGGELRGIAALNTPTQLGFLGDPPSKLATMPFLATRERGYGLRMMQGIAQSMIQSEWDLNFAATDKSIGFYLAIGMQPVREGGMIFSYTPDRWREWKGNKGLENEAAQAEPEDGVFVSNGKAALENELISEALKGGPGSGHHGHAGIPGHQGGSAPSGSAGGAGGGGKAQFFDRPTDEKIALWQKQIDGWAEGPRKGMASTALLTISQERMAHVVIEDSTGLKAIACLSIPRVRHSIFGDEPPRSKIAAIFYCATRERGSGLEMMRGIARQVVEKDWQLSFNATDASIGFYRAIGLTPEKEGGKSFFIESQELAAWLKTV